MIYACSIKTPLGMATAAATGASLTGFWFIEQKYYPQAAHLWPEDPDAGVFKALRLWLAEYFAKKQPPLDIPLAPQGTDFQKAVWDILLQIPYGQTVTYGAIAGQIAHQSGVQTMSAQAVGGAVGHNPVSLLIPCHRVVGASGSLTGYAGGLERKKALLHMEGAPLSKK